MAKCTLRYAWEGECAHTDRTLGDGKEHSTVRVSERGRGRYREELARFVLSYIYVVETCIIRKDRDKEKSPLGWRVTVARGVAFGALPPHSPECRICAHGPTKMSALVLHVKIL